MRRLSPWGCLLFTIWGLVLALILDGWRLATLVVLQVVFGLSWSRKGLGPLRRFRFWILVLAALAVPAVLSPLVSKMPGRADGDLASAGVGASCLLNAGLLTGLDMAGRALALTLSFSLGLSALSLSDVMAIFGRFRLRGLGFALGVAMNLFSTLQEMATVTFQTIRLRAGLRRPLVALRLFLVTLLSNTMHYGDQVVKGASVRAFDPNSDRYSATCPELLLRRADLGLLLILAVCGILLLFVGR